MKASTIIRILALAVVLSAAGQSAWATAIPDGKSAYVLSVDANGVIGFRQYTGTDAIPAGKAYYIKTD